MQDIVLLASALVAPGWGSAHHKGGGSLQGGEERESGDAGRHNATTGVEPLCPHVWKRSSTQPR